MESRSVSGWKRRVSPEVPFRSNDNGWMWPERFASLADVMIAVEPDGSLAGWWDAAGAGRPARKVGQMPICWGPDQDECIGRAHEQFRWFGGGWKVNAELPGTAGFAGATSFVRSEDVAGSIPCGDSVDAVAEQRGRSSRPGYRPRPGPDRRHRAGAGPVPRGRTRAHRRVEGDRRLVPLGSAPGAAIILKEWLKIEAGRKGH
jgi:hypothetical protein